MSRYWKCTMTNDEDSFRVGDVYETDDEKRNFVDGTNFYFVDQCIDELSIASFEEVIEETKEELKMQKYGDKYWKCTYSEGDWFEEGKIYISDTNGRSVTNEHGMKLTASIPIDFIPKYKFKEVSHDDWMEQEYKVYYDEEKEMKKQRYWKCVMSNDDNDFTEGRVYVSNERGYNFEDNSSYVWKVNNIESLINYKFIEVDENGQVLKPSSCNKEENKLEESNYEMVNHPSHYNSNSKGIEVIDAMDAFTEGLVGIDAIDIGTAIKYIGRLGKKDNPVQEVKKAIWYLQHYVDRKEEENDND